MVVHILLFRESLKTYFTGMYFNVVPFKSENGKGNRALNLKIEKYDYVKVSCWWKDL